MNSSNSSITRVIFFQVRDNATKLKYICETAQLHFEKKDFFSIFVDDEKGETFVDELLWKLPETSFLPHAIADQTTQERIVITKLKKNFNNSRMVFNLCSTPLSIEGSFKIIYEFEDHTNPMKQRLSTIRFDAYKKMGFSIEAR